MTKDLNDHEPGVLRVFQSKDQIKAYYNKIARAYDPLVEHSEQPMRAKGLARLAARPGERILADRRSARVESVKLPSMCIPAADPAATPTCR